VLAVGALEDRDGVAGPAGVVERDRIDVGEARRVGPGARRPPQQVDRLRQAVLAHPHERQGMQRLGVVRLGSKRLLQEPLAVRVPALDPQEVGEVHERRDKGRVEPQRGAELRLGVCPATQTRVEVREVHVRLGPLRVDQLRLDQLRHRAVEVHALRLGQGAARGAGEHLGGREAHAAHRIAEQRRAERRPPLGREGIRAAQRAEPHERVGVGEPRLDRGRHRGRRELSEVRESGGPHDARLASIGRDGDERRRGVRETASRGVERAGEVRSALSRPAPSLDAIDRPLGRAVAVTAGAGIRRAERRRQVGSRHPEAVVPSRVHHHVGARGHVAAHALGALRRRLVMMVGLGVEARREVTLGADGVAGLPQRRAMRVVAVRAGDPRPVHAALEERAPLVDFAEDLAVGMVERGIQQGRRVRVEERLAVGMRVDDRPAARMAPRADVELHRGPRRPRPLGDAALGILHGPGSVAAPEGDHQAVTAPRLVRGPRGPGLRPGHVGRSGPVTLLARHRDVRPRGGVAVRREVVSLPEIRRVAFGALVVPRLLAPRPVEGIRRTERHVRVEMEPPLASLGARARVPREAQRLDPTVGEGHQILLERVDAERVGNLELTGLPVGALGADEVLPVAAEEGRRDTPVRDAGLVEAPEDRVGCGGLHRAGMVRTAKRVRFLRVAAGALGGTHEGRRRGLGRRRGRLGALAAGPDDEAGEGQRQDRTADPGADWRDGDCLGRPPDHGMRL